MEIADNIFRKHFQDKIWMIHVQILVFFVKLWKVLHLPLLLNKRKPDLYKFKANMLRRSFCETFFEIETKLKRAK